MTITNSRHLPLAGTYNVRDVGGYPTAGGGVTRWRTLFRADALHRLADPAELADAGLRTVIDLREDGERRAAPDALHGLSVEVAHIPVFAGGPPPEQVELGPLYDHIVDERGAALARAIAVLGRPDALPALVHCTAGKDRTGLVIALALAVAGVPDEVIAEDYALTGDYLGEEFAEEARTRLAGLGLERAMHEAVMKLHLACPAEQMTRTLARIRERHGDVPGYLRHHGVSDDRITTLRAHLTDR
ncbi:tyrosine-protein phosphatase [Spongiactinospora sp. 9N601]|uniref:tyrosine-protein phosphatase n=1 Tax=Spongiactinospora sp. 9N601 TaxID=3375149 RepID=UPI0037AF5479